MFLQDHSSSVNSKLTVKFQSTVHAQTSVQALAYESPQPLSCNSGSPPSTVERVQYFKLLGTTVSSDLNWQKHIDTIISKASSRIYFLRILKNSGLHQHHLRHFYVTVIRPVLEYCSVVWHHGLTKAQAESLEAIQRRALRIIYPVTYDFPYDAALSIAQVASLFDRREQLNRHFFKSILSHSSCIFSLFPPPRDLNVASRLRTASTYPRPTTRTKRYTSFVQHGLLHYQTE